jgi:hypothetical protein
VSNAIVQYNATDVMTVAQQLVASGFLPAHIKQAQAFAIITLGQELGIGAWAALNGINVIQNKPTVSPQLMLGLINRTGQLEDMSISDDGKACACTMKRRGRSAHTETFSVSDAAAMGLSNKSNWKAQPAVMRKWRAVAACARVVFPDAIQGLYTTEEIAPDFVQMSDDGEMTVVEPSHQIAPPAPEQPIIPQYYDENGHDLPDAPDQVAPQEKFLGFSVAAVTRVGKNGKCHDLILNNGARVTIYTRDPLRALSPLWADTVKTWDEPGTHAFLDIAGELDVYSTGKGYAFGIPDAFANLHAVPDEMQS